ncbi:MAG TPA: hypothetical protein VLX92_28400 [Kofleriaceae bacterium]|nr:hypothetical protein [Kofleriaceae bacterium]
MHYHYVANKIYVPSNSTEANEYGLDLDGNGTVDNQLGSVLGTLSGQGFDVQGTVDTAIADGSIILLIDFQAKDLMNTTAAGVQVYLGANPQPPACDGSADTTCGHHLTGSASFDIGSNSPMDAALAGKIVAGTFTGGSQKSDLELQIALGGTQAISLDLIGARAKGSEITDTTIGTATDGGMIFAGALSTDDLNNTVIPAIAAQLGPIVQRDCCGLSTSPGGVTCDPNANPSCGCTSGSTGAQLLSLFDTMPKDCTVTVSEIQNNNLIKSLLAPDVTINGTMALSLGIKATAVGATYTVTGEM